MAADVRTRAVGGRAVVEPGGGIGRDVDRQGGGPAALPPRSGRRSGRSACPIAPPSVRPAYRRDRRPNPAASVRPENDASGEGAGTGRRAITRRSRATSDVSHDVRSSGPDPLLLVSASFLLVGLGLFLLRWGARRLGDG